MLKPDPKLLALFAEVSQLTEEISRTVSIPFITNSLVEIKSRIKLGRLEVDLCYFTGQNVSFVQAVSGWLGIDSSAASIEKLLNEGAAGNIEPEDTATPVRISVRPFEKITSAGLGEIKSPLTVFLVGEKNGQDPDYLPKILSLTVDLPHLLVVAEDKEIISAIRKSDLSKNVLKLEVLSLADMLQTDTLQRKIMQQDFWDIYSAAFSYNCAQSVETLFSVITLAIEQEERSLKAKKVMNQQQVLRIQSATKVNFQEVISQLKNSINHQTSLIEKGILTSLENDIRPQTGKFSKEVEQFSMQLESLEQSNSGKNSKLSLPKEVEEQFFQMVYGFYQKTGQENLITIRDGFKSLEIEIEKFLSKNDLPPFPLSFKYLTDQSLLLYIESAVRWERPYEGSMPRKGLYEYFMAMRKYQMLLFMMASSFGLSFLKGMKLYMLPVTIVLLGIGGYSVYVTVEKETAENEKKELDKARETLKAEGKRMGSEISRQWGRLISEYLRAQTNHIIASYETVLKEYFQKTGAEEEEDKKKVQRQMQSLDNFERKFSNILRNKESIYRNVLRAKSDFRQDFSRTSRKV